MTADVQALSAPHVATLPAVSARRLASLLLGLSFFCWAHLTISRPLFPGSPASHDIFVYASPLIALAALVAAWSARRLHANRWLLAGSLLWLLAALAGVPGATDPALALTWTLWLAIALTLLASGVDRPAMGAGLAVGALASLPVMIFQAMAQTTWPAAAIQGWAGGELGPAVRGAAVLGDERWLRPYGLMPHPNIAGGVAALACVLLAAVWLRERRLWQLAGSAAAFSDVLLSFSRSAWLGAAAGLVLLICLRRGGTRPLLAAIVLPALLFGLACGGLIVQRTAASGTLESDSLSQRIYLVQTAMQLWHVQPLVGIGPAQFSQAEVDAYGPSFIPEPVHNSLFLVLAESGVLGLAGATVVAAIAGKGMLKRRDWETTATALAVLSPLMLDHYLMTTGIGLMLVAAAVSSGSVGSAYDQLAKGSRTV